jgi:hypothetical protein
MMIGYDSIYDHFTMEHFPLCQRMILTTSFFLLATVPFWAFGEGFKLARNKMSV